MTRYEIHAIADANCTTIHEAAEASADTISQAKRLAAQHSTSLYGAAILDTQTREIDFGFGFGRPVSDMEG